jgi:isoleucyl-tRNA synthetase
VWGTRYPDAGSVHLLEWPTINPAWRDLRLAFIWGTAIRPTRSIVTGVVEPQRQQKTIGSSLEAVVDLYQRPTGMIIEGRDAADIIWDYDLAEICIVASVNRQSMDDYAGSMTDERGEKIDARSVEAIAGSARRTHDHKCGRCWRYLPEVKSDGELCGRCEDVLNG